MAESTKVTRDFEQNIRTLPLCFAVPIVQRNHQRKITNFNFQKEGNFFHNK